MYLGLILFLVTPDCLLTFPPSQGGYHLISQAAVRHYSSLFRYNIWTRSFPALHIGTYAYTLYIHYLHLPHRDASYYQHLVSFTVSDSVLKPKALFIVWCLKLLLWLHGQVHLYSAENTGKCWALLLIWQYLLANVSEETLLSPLCWPLLTWPAARLLGDLTSLFHLLILCWQAQKIRRFEKEFQ